MQSNDGYCDMSDLPPDWCWHCRKLTDTVSEVNADD